MQARVALVAVGLIVALGGGAGAVGGVGLVAPRRIEPLMFSLQGTVKDNLCPDAYPSPMIGLVPPSDTDEVLPEV